MFVEAAFWFHPAVWWLGARLVEERERACDEAVVEMGSRPGVYAEGLLKAVRFCVESPLACVAGVTGADLSRRVRSIMTLRLERLGWGRKLVLVLVALTMVAVPVLLGQGRAAQRMMLAAVNAAPKPVRAWAAAHAPIALEETPSTGLIAEMQADAAPTPGATDPTRDDTAATNGAPGDQRQVLHGAYKVWLEQDVRWVITDQEVEAYRRLANDKERDKFIEQFWLRRNPNPGAADNAYRDEIYARIKYANEHFADDKPGWMTDRGHVYIVYGKPDEVYAQPGIGADTWTYRHIAGVGDNIVLKFASGAGLGRYRLMPPVPAGLFGQGADPTRDDKTVTNGAPAEAEKPNPLKRRLTDAERVRAAYVPAMKFEVATIKPCPPGYLHRSMYLPGGTAENFGAGMATVESLIGFAYGIDFSLAMGPGNLYMPHPPELIGAPEWVSTDRYDLAAKADAATVAAWSKLPEKQQDEELKSMMRALLAERFHLTMGHERREMPVWALVVAKGGPKLKTTAGLPADVNEPGDEGYDESKPLKFRLQGGAGLIQGWDIAIDALTSELWLRERELDGRKILDRTGLTGAYDMTLKWDPTDTTGPSLFTAIQEQLGLKLESTKAPMDVLVIDHIDRPSAN
jgi:uncharacterized protein (TIGR03435 family)